MVSEIDPEELSKIMKRLDVKMDDLVVKLKHMDYRDFLAVNKYILESKKSEEYHIIARGKVLSAAMKKLNEDKRSQIDSQLKRNLQNSEAASDDVRDLKLKAYMEENDDLKSMYRDEFNRVKKGEFKFIIFIENTKDTTPIDLSMFDPEYPFEDDFSEEEMYSRKLIGWYKTSKELQEEYEDRLSKADNEEARDNVKKQFARYRQQLYKKKQLSANLKSIRSELMYKHSMKDVTFENMILEKDKFGAPEPDQEDFKEVIKNTFYNKIVDLQPGDATNEVTQKWQEFQDKFKNKYFKAKWGW